KSSACVFLGCALLFLAGKAALVVRAGGVPPARGLELALWSVFAASSAVYLAALWREEPRLRARAYPAALFLGVTALFASAGVHRLGPLLSPAAVLDRKSTRLNSS